MARSPSRARVPSCRCSGWIRAAASSGMTVEFTAMAAASTLVLERLVKRRESQSRRRAARGAADPGRRTRPIRGRRVRPSRDRQWTPIRRRRWPRCREDRIRPRQHRRIRPAPRHRWQPSRRCRWPSPGSTWAGRSRRIGANATAAPTRDGRRPRRDRGAHTSGVSWHGRRLRRAASLGYFTVGRPPHGSDPGQTPIVAAAKPVPSALPAAAPVALIQLAAEPSPQAAESSLRRESA